MPVIYHRQKPSKNWTHQKLKTVTGKCWKVYKWELANISGEPKHGNVKGRKNGKLRRRHRDTCLRIDGCFTKPLILLIYNSWRLTKMEVAAIEASLVALANSSGDRENASSQRLEVQISVTTRAAKKHHEKPHCDGDKFFELRRLLLNLCSWFLPKNIFIFSTILI